MLFHFPRARTARVLLFVWEKLAANGRRPTTLPEANRAEGNVGEARAAARRTPSLLGFKGDAWAVLLGARTNRSYLAFARRTPNGRGVGMEKHFQQY
jgi:hypothetical protein